MNLYLLKPIEAEDGIFFDYDIAIGFVIRAESTKQARQVANDAEGNGYYDIKNPWLNSKYTSCTKIKNSGKKAIILTDFRAG